LLGTPVYLDWCRTRGDISAGLYFDIFHFVSAVSSVIGAYTMYIGTLNAANILHRRVVKNILRNPSHFFDTTPVGRILSRFSKDIDVLDNTLPGNLRMVPLFGFRVCKLRVLFFWQVFELNKHIFKLVARIHKPNFRRNHAFYGFMNNTI
jgi:ABC-type multidrug transport system fused ATPase/permease subunit